MRRYKLDKNEEAILASYERGEWKPVKNMEARLKEYAEYAKQTLKKNQRISIRVSKQDLLGIQEKAVEEGLPYQTLITSIVHKYVAGRLVARVS